MSSSLNSEDIEILEQQQIVIKTGGKRTVNGAFLSPPSSQGTASSSLFSGRSSASISLRSFSNNVSCNIGLPLEEESIDALEWIGFTTSAANEILSNFIGRPHPDQNPDELLDYAIGYIRGRDQKQDVPDFAAMTRMGLKTDFQDSLMDPRFETIRGTHTLHYWIKDTLRINWRTMTMQQDRLKRAAEHIKSSNKKAKQESIPHAATISQPAASSSSTPPPSDTVTLSMIAGMQSVPEQHNLPAVHVSVEDAGPILEDHVVLYKASAACDVEGMIGDDGQLEIGRLQTYGEGDFNPVTNVAWYWTPESEYAEIYRAYAARRCEWSETWVIRIQIPRAAVNALRREELWYGHDWKEYVWYCRKKLEPPPNYDYLRQQGQADIVKGHICSKAPNTVRIQKGNVQTEISSDFVMTLANGEKATQWAFMQLKSFERTMALAQGKTHIDITQALGMQKRVE